MPQHDSITHVIISDMSWHLIGSSTDGKLDIVLVPPTVVTIGRVSECSVHLTQKQVSRLHAEIHWAPGIGREQGHWRIRDLGSSKGTHLNGVKLTPHREVRICHADVLEIAPWKFKVEGPASDKTVSEFSPTVIEEPDAEGEYVAVSAVQSPADLAQGMLVRLLEASEEFSKAEDESAVGHASVESLSSATGFANVAFLREGADPQSFRVIAHKGAIIGARGELQVSRSLIKRSRNGIYVHRSGPSAGATLDASLALLAIRQAICVPVEAGKMFFGWIYLDNRTGSGSESHEPEAVRFAAAVARLAGLSLSNIERGLMQKRFDLEKQELFGGTMLALIATIDSKDPYTRGHSLRVSEYAMMLARAAELPEEHIEQARVCGLVHDIGKMYVPDAILRKPTQLDEAEFALIREHPENGRRILEQTPQMRDLLPGVVEHHERWDGSGYPYKLKGEKISRLGRVLCIADCFDAMTSARFYRPARSIESVRIEIEKCLGTHFDPDLGRIFLSIREADLAAAMVIGAPATGDLKVS